MMKFILISALICLAAAGPIVDKADQIDEPLTKVQARELKVSKSEPWNVTEWGFNPCETTRNFNYFVAFPNDTARYIQCDPWGTGLIKTCIDGTVWNMWSLCCEESENIRNLTIVLPHRVFNCSLTGHECLNGGVCTESSLGGDRCVCKPDFTGPLCESHTDMTDLTHSILNSTFDLHEFRDHLAALNVSVDVSVYERYRDQLDNLTFTALMRYISLYKGREVRYDTLINNLVEAVLENIYPDAAYLSSFNASAVSVVELVQLIPNLMSYSKYSLERYPDVFAKYQQVIDRLSLYINSTHSHMRNEAVQYSRLTCVFMNQTMALMNQTSNVTGMDNLLHHKTDSAHLTADQILESLRMQFNSTLETTKALFAGLEGFQRDVMALVANSTEGTDVYKMTIANCKLNGTVEVVKMLEQISSSSVQVWDQLVNYGFWYITSAITSVEKSISDIADVADVTEVAADVTEVAADVVSTTTVESVVVVTSTTTTSTTTIVVPTSTKVEETVIEKLNQTVV